MPWEDMLLFSADEGDHEAVCPCILDRADDLGFDVFAGFEYEFFVFENAP